MLAVFALKICTNIWLSKHLINHKIQNNSKMCENT